MDSAVISLLGAFTLSILGLFAFIWSLRQGLLVENPRGASVIFAQGEIGQVDDPALTRTTYVPETSDVMSSPYSRISSLIVAR